MLLLLLLLLLAPLAHCGAFPVDRAATQCLFSVLQSKVSTAHFWLLRLKLVHHIVMIG